MKILITGVAGFIGSNLANHLLTKNHQVIGLDNFDNYYSIAYKKKRVKNLKKFKKFKFVFINLKDRKKVFKVFSKYKIQLVINLAAQAGVRNSFLDPKKYIDCNISSFLNIIFASKKYNVKKIIYASSSSVYGDAKKFPLNEKINFKQKNIYAVTKKLNEQIAETYSIISKINFIGLRFFTIYGNWGRPDMFLYKMFKSSVSKKVFKLNNYGNHLRDFTYIEDVNLIFEKLINKKFKNNQIFNICSNNPINILKICNTFKKKYLLKLKFIKKHKADILTTHGDNTKIKRYLKIKKFSNFENKLQNLFNFYRNKKIYKF